LSLGHAYLDIPKLRDLDAAQHWYEYSLDHRNEADYLGRARCVGQLGRVHHERFLEAREAGRPDAELLAHLNAAASAYQQALELLPVDAINDLAVCHSQLGNIYADGNKPDLALRHYEEAIHNYETAGNRYNAARARAGVAVNLVRSGRFGDALLWAQATLRDYQAYGDRAAADIAETQRFIAYIERNMTHGEA
jgi:tetratricopeptide (TPR) repeat protein